MIFPMIFQEFSSALLSSLKPGVHKFFYFFWKFIVIFPVQDNPNALLYSGLLDEFVAVLELKDPVLTEIKAATLRTLTSIIHLERVPNFPK